MIQRFKSRFQGSSEVSAEGGTRTEKLRRFQTTFSLVYWLVTLLVLAYAFSLARIGDRPLLIGLALIAATINFLFLHFRPLRFSFSHGALTMVVVTSVFALLLVYWTGPLDSPFFAAILLLVLTASLVLSRLPRWQSSPRSPWHSLAWSLSRASWAPLLPFSSPGSNSLRFG